MSNFNNQYADLLHVRIGDAIAQLRQQSSKYNNLVEQRTTIIRGKYDTYNELHDAYTRLIEITQIINDIEQNYLFVCGMLEHKKVLDTLVSDEFFKDFADV